MNHFCFRNHEHGALNIFNCPNVTVRHCTFRNNTSTSYFTRKPYQGNSGGLSLGYNMELAPLSSVNVLVTDCVFINNSADPPSDLFLTTSDLFQKHIFSGRGGGMAIPINVTCPHCPVNVTINDNLFRNNFVRNFGGGLYCFINGTTVNLTYMFRNNTFVGNIAEHSSAALSFANFAQSSTLHGIIYDCTFKYNEAKVGGCLHLFPSYHGFSGNFFAIRECSFDNNTSTGDSGTIVIASYKYYQNREHYDPVEFTNW